MSANLTNYSSSQDLSNGFRENWASAFEQLNAQYDPLNEWVGKRAEQHLRANGGDSYNYLTIAELESGEIDPYAQTAADSSTITKDLMILDQTSEYKFQREEDEKGLSQTYESFFARQTEAALKAHLKDKCSTVLSGAYINSPTELDDGSFGGTAGNAFSVTAASIDNMSFEAQGIINEDAQEDGNINMVITPRMTARVALSAWGNGSAVSDDMFTGGLKGMSSPKVRNAFGLSIYQTLFLPHGRNLTFTGDAANANTLTVGGVVLDILTTLTGAEGEVLLGANAAATIVNIVDLLQNPTKANATGKGFAKNSASHKTLRGFTAKRQSNTVLTIISKFGDRFSTTSEVVTNATLASATDIYVLATHFGAIEVASPRGVRLFNGMSADGTVQTFTSRERFGYATPTNDLVKFKFIKTVLG